MKNGTGKLGVVLLLSLMLGGCSTWDGMSKRERSAVIGAGVGGVAW